MVGVTWKGSRGRPSLPGRESSPPLRLEERRTSAPAVSYRDKAEYQELFKPLPRPEPIPAFNTVKIETKPWRQLQEERDAMVEAEIERTKREAEDMWQRAMKEDKKRLDVLETERGRIEAEQSAREEILRRDAAEWQQKDAARKEEIRRQEALLTGRLQRAKTADPTAGRLGAAGGGIQIYHYKDPVVVDIVRQAREEEMMRRRAGQADPLYMQSAGRVGQADPLYIQSAGRAGQADPLCIQSAGRVGQADPLYKQSAGRAGQADPLYIQSQSNGNTIYNSQISQAKSTDVGSSIPQQNTEYVPRPVAASTRQFHPAEPNTGNLYRSVMDGKEFFKVGDMVRSQSSSSSSTVVSR